MTNKAALGYVLIAAGWSELTEEDTKLLLTFMFDAMDEFTEEEAEKRWRKNVKGKGGNENG